MLVSPQFPMHDWACFDLDMGDADYHNLVVAILVYCTYHGH